MLARVNIWLKRIGLAFGLVLITIFAVRAWDAWRAPPLELWHTEVPHELDAPAIDAADWPAWLTAEDAVFAEARSRVTDKLPAGQRVAANRFFADGPLYSPRFAADWNRSYLLTPEGAPRGAVILLHGLTDSPYSLRHVGARYQARGFVVVSIRMPGHGTVPAGLTKVRWKEWMAATRLAARTARERAGAGTPLHVVGYSNGGALALEYALESLDDAQLPRPDRIVLISPMVGITSLARFAGVLGWPAVFPPFAKAAWLDIAPEYNPFKYNSFPVNAARQSSQLVRVVDAKLAARFERDGLAGFPPVLAFQSALDATVSARALFGTLLARLPDNGSAVVLFDRNRGTQVEPLVRDGGFDVLEQLTPATPRRFAVTLVTNSASDPAREEARTVRAGGGVTMISPLEPRYPPDLYSLSHVALPFPASDGLYGGAPDAQQDFGVRLGTVAVRGERGALVVSSETLMRATWNPFFDYLLTRIDETM
jgi:alpha-beta hydrolase superfamily lysophospholipase